MRLDHGPIDFIMIGFPDSQASPRVAEAIHNVVDTGVITILDLIFVSRNLDGDATIVELSELDEGAHDLWDMHAEDVGKLLSDDDAIQLASSLEPGSSAVLVLYENTWARELATAVLGAQGHVILNTRIPREVVDELAAEVLG